LGYRLLPARWKQPVLHVHHADHVAIVKLPAKAHQAQAKMAAAKAAKTVFVQTVFVQFVKFRTPE